MGTTKEIIAGMLTENTGRHMLDSGGAYGRAWERNQDRNFEAEQPTVIEWDYDSISITHSVFHWLAERLEYSTKLDAEFHKWAGATEERRDTGWLELMEGWTKHLNETPDDDGETHEVGGVYGEGDPLVVNTYNGEDLLSQIIQYLYFEIDGESYVLLQIHGGCDARGGYTAPKVFEVDGTEIFDNARAGISCDDDKCNPNQTEIPGLESGPCERRWYTDDGWNWYNDDDGEELQAYPVTKAEDGDAWRVNHLHINEDNSLCCPGCGGHLSAGFI